MCIHRHCGTTFFAVVWVLHLLVLRKNTGDSTPVCSKTLTEIFASPRIATNTGMCYNSFTNNRNINWRIHCGFQNGVSGYADFVCFGYKHGDYGESTIDETDAVIVRSIFQMKTSGTAVWPLDAYPNFYKTRLIRFIVITRHLIKIPICIMWG